MAGILKKITVAVKNRTTYRVGLLQTKAYRDLMQETTDILSKYNISPVEWAFLGLLYDNEQMRSKDAAEELGVEPPFVTSMFKKLHAKGLISNSIDPTDSRAKALCLSEKGAAFVKENEPKVRSGMMRMIEGIDPRDILTYLSVLEAISLNAKKLEEKGENLK